MSSYLSEQIRKCRRKAEDCAQRAAAQTDPKLKQDFLDLKESWLLLARTFAYHERQSDSPEKAKRIEAISAATHRRRQAALRAVMSLHDPRTGDGVIGKGPSSSVVLFC